MWSVFLPVRSHTSLSSSLAYIQKPRPLLLRSGRLHGPRGLGTFVSTDPLPITKAPHALNPPSYAGQCGTTHCV
jgi:hypothetical protein